MNNIDTIFQQKALRNTPMRQLLLEYFLQESNIVGLGELEKAFPKADRITIYRTLKTFEEKGIIHPIENGTSGLKYALCQADCSSSKHLDQHPHFHCQQCGKISCLKSVYIPSVSLPEGYLAEEVNMNIKGICGDCNIVLQ